jgi:hypothetical protein
VPALSCLSDDDCSEAKTNLTNNVCVISGSAKVCNCRNGEDACALRGVCTPYCEAPMIVGLLAAQNALVGGPAFFLCKERGPRCCVSWGRSVLLAGCGRFNSSVQLLALHRSLAAGQAADGRPPAAKARPPVSTPRPTPPKPPPAPQIKPCTANANCSATEVCAPTSKCFTLACNESAITTTECESNSVCVPAARAGATGAAFDPTRRTIAVTLNSPARAGPVACDALFTANATALLGASPRCEVADAEPGKLLIRLQPSATIKKNDLLATANQSVLVDALTAMPFNFSLALADCAVGACKEPFALLTAPAVSAPGAAPAPGGPECVRACCAPFGLQRGLWCSPGLLSWPPAAPGLGRRRGADRPQSLRPQQVPTLPPGRA